jgi:hypothetical protein
LSFTSEASIGATGEAGDDGVAHEGIVLLFRGELEQFGCCGRLFEFAEGDGGVEANA